MLSPVCRSLILIFCFSLISGCGGEKRASVKGRLIVDGKALKWESPFPLELTLRSENLIDTKQSGKSFSAQVDPDGVFVVQGDDGKGIPLANYKMTIRSTAYGNPDVVKKSRQPWLKGIDDQSKTTLSYDVNSVGELRLVIDVVKKTVQREP